MSFAELLSYISTLTVFIPFLLCLQAIRKKEKFIIALFVLLCTSILTSGLTEYYIQMGSETSLLCLNVYTLFEFTGISIVYALLLPHLKKLIYGTVLLFVAFFIANCYWLESIHTIQDYPLVIESVIVIAYCIAYFFHSLKEVGHDYSVLRDGKFWINIAFVSY